MLEHASGRILYNEARPPVVVVGAGPGGAAAALLAAEKGYKVLVITKYLPIRGQQIHLDSSQEKLLEQFRDPNDPLDTMFFERLKATRSNIPLVGSVAGYTASVESIERYWLHKLWKARKDGKIQLVTSQQGELADVNLENNTITIKKPDSSTVTIPFQHLVDASGVPRVATRLADKAENREDIETPLPDQLQHPHAAQGTAILRLNEDRKDAYPKLKHGMIEFAPTIFVPKFSAEETRALKDRFNWDEVYPPKVYIIANADRTKFYVGGEIPSSILKIADEAQKRAEVERWSRYMLEHHFGIKSEDLYIKGQTEEEKREKADKYVGKYEDRYGIKLTAEAAMTAARKKADLQVTAFAMTLTQLDNPARDVSQNHNGSHVMVSIGDALQSPNFHRGHGLNDALRGAREFGQCLPRADSGGTFDLERFEGFTQALHNEHAKRMREIQKEYKAKEQEFSAKEDKHEASVKTAAVDENQPVEKTRKEKAVRLVEPAVPLSSNRATMFNQQGTGRQTARTDANEAQRRHTITKPR